MDVGARRQVLTAVQAVAKAQGRREEATESGGEPVGRVLTLEEQERLFKATELSGMGEGETD